jgi:L-ascorbate 6-phosphate lactonase
MVQKVAGLVELTWLGQAGFLLRTDETSLAIDPFLSEHELRLYPPPPPSVLGRLDMLLVSHEHGDHFDVDLLRSLGRDQPQLQVILPTPLVDHARGLAPGLIVTGLQPGEEVRRPGVLVAATSAIHAADIGDGYSDGQAGGDTAFLGFVIRLPGLRLYHAGDTLCSEALLEELRQLQVDVAILPTNGRDWFRERSGIVGNLAPREAVQMAVAIGARLLVPMHHDMIRTNTEAAGACSDAAAALQAPLHVLSMARLLPLWLPELSE